MGWWSSVRNGITRYIGEYPIRKNIALSQVHNVRRDVSPGGRYLIKTTTYRRPSRIEFSTLEVFNPSGKRVVDLPRDSSEFPYLIVQDHSDGHDYLVGPTLGMAAFVIGLDHEFYKEVSSGRPYTPAEFFPSPDKRVVGIFGNGNGYPWEFAAIDFRDPKRIEYVWKFDRSVHNVVALDDGRVELSYEIEVRSSDMRPVDELDLNEARLVSRSGNTKELEVKEIVDLNTLI